MNGKTKKIVAILDRAAEGTMEAYVTHTVDVEQCRKLNMLAARAWQAGNPYDTQNFPAAAWLATALKAGRDPRFVVLEEVEGANQAERRRVAWLHVLDRAGIKVPVQEDAFIVGMMDRLYGRLAEHGLWAPSAEPIDRMRSHLDTPGEAISCQPPKTLRRMVPDADTLHALLAFDGAVTTAPGGAIKTTRTQRQLCAHFDDGTFLVNKGDPLAPQVMMVRFALRKAGLSIRSEYLVELDSLRQVYEAAARRQEAGRDFTGPVVVVNSFLDEVRLRLRGGGADDAVTGDTRWNAPSPWRDGPVRFLGADRRDFPFMPGDSEPRPSAIDLVCGTPGSGKTTLLNTVALGFVTAVRPSGGGTPALPLLAMIDVEGTAGGVASVLLELLPPALRHQVALLRLQMTREAAVNPFDTHPGLRRPLPLQRAWLVNFLTLLLSPVGTDMARTTADLAGLLIDEVYARTDDTARRAAPKRYEPNCCAEVDQALRLIDAAGSDASWWSVSDRLRRAGRSAAADAAQAWAVPQLADLLEALNSPAVDDAFGDTRIGGHGPFAGDLLIDLAGKLISCALREYPILTGPTCQRVSEEARVRIIDISDVAPRGSAAADKQSAMMWMLARKMAAEDFWLNEEVISLARGGAEALAWLHARVRLVRSTPRLLVCDGADRMVRTSKPVADQMVADAREARKWGIAVMISASSPDIFRADLADLATGLWVLGVGSAPMMDVLTERFGLSGSTLAVLRHGLVGPSGDGVRLLARFTTLNSTSEHLVHFVADPEQLWALATRIEDRILRDRLIRRLGPAAARRALAQSFPSGSAAAEIESRYHTVRGLSAGEPDMERLIEAVYQEIVRQHTAA